MCWSIWKLMLSAVEAVARSHRRHCERLWRHLIATERMLLLAVEVAVRSHQSCHWYDRGWQMRGGYGSPAVEAVVRNHLIHPWRQQGWWEWMESVRLAAEAVVRSRQIRQDHWMCWSIWKLMLSAVEAVARSRRIRRWIYQVHLVSHRVLLAQKTQHLLLTVVGKVHYQVKNLEMFHLVPLWLDLKRMSQMGSQCQRDFWSHLIHLIHSPPLLLETIQREIGVLGPSLRVMR